MSESYEGLDIAIVGLAGRFPGANNIDEFWELLKNGVEAISYFTDEELSQSGIDPLLLKDPNYIKSRCIIKDEDLFDANFFDLFPREVEMMDPQQRIFLETCWQALEEAGYDADRYKGLIGVFGGVSLNTYLFSYLLSQKGFISSAEGYQLSIGNDKDFLTTRVSYKLNLKGPSVNVQTACSTSLVAVHLACQNLLNYSCDMALAGGVSITIPQKQGYYYQEGMILSSDGHCRTFDAKASGTISGNGVGVVVLKRLSDALQDGDHIYALIKGSAFNNDGAMRAGYTAPSVDGQSEVIANAQAVAGIEPESITYIEAHGTGTVIGDPIEITALSQVFREQTNLKQFCGIGSVKTNIGHLDAAAGVAGLIKTSLALHHKMIPASLNYKQANPAIDFVNSPFYVVDQLKPWKSNGQTRRAGVSSFGIGGTNVHAVLEEAPKIESSDQGKGQYLISLSAKTKSALEKTTLNLVEYLKNNPQVNLADVAFTLHLGRKFLNHRLTLVADAPQKVMDILQRKDPKRIFSISHSKDPVIPPIAFMFSGQGAQYVNMGKELYQTETIFRQAVDECCEILKDFLKTDLRKVLYPTGSDTEKATEQINQTGFTQPSLFVIEYALAKLLMAWGIKPQAMVGHSIGEYVAACLSGVFSLADALKLVSVRGSLMQRVPAGAMVSVAVEESEITPLLDKNLSVAALNAKGMTVISGTFESIENLEQELVNKHIEFRRLHTSHAFHSAMMDSILDEFREVVNEIKLNEPQLPYLSNVSGTWITNEQALDSNYYVTHIRRTVRFSDNVSELLKSNEMILLEIGPGTTLTSLAKRHPNNSLGRNILATMHHPQDETSDQAYLLTTLGRLWLVGVDVDWFEFYRTERRLRLSLPAYPFEKQRYWLNRPGTKSMGGAMSSDVIQKKGNISEWFYIPSWKQLNMPLPPKHTLTTKLNWLIFKDTTGLSSNFITHLDDTTRNTIIVESGGVFEQKAANHFSIAMDKPEDYIKLFEILSNANLFPDYIIHFWNVTVFSQQEIPFEKEHIPGFKSILFLAKALAKYSIKRKIELGIITNQLFNITGFENYKPGKAMVLGLAKVIPQEFPSIHTRVIDVQLPKGLDLQISDLALQVASEFLDDRKDLTVAFRSRQRWVQDYESIKLDTSAMFLGYMREKNVYLITGGLGRIGLALAEKFAKELKANLILIDCFDFPDQNSWPEILIQKAKDDPLVLRIKRLQEIMKRGSEILIYKADIGDQAELKEAVDRALEKFKQINGVIHAAGIVGAHAFKAIPELQEPDWNDQFHAKVRGAINIADLIAPLRPDFILLQSSMSAILGGLGFGAYAAANAFLDAIAFQENQKGLSQWIVVNWDGWNFEQALPESRVIGAEIAQLAILPEEGLQAFERILSYRGLTQLVVSTGDLHARIDKWIKLKALQASEESIISPEAMDLHARPNLATEYVEPQNELQKDIAAIWQRLLGIGSIGIFDDFFDLGGNSLMGTQLISQLRESFQVELPLRSLFEDPTISGVSKIIEAERQKTEKSAAGKITDMLEQMEKMSQEQAATLLKDMKDKQK